MMRAVALRRHVSLAYGMSLRLVAALLRSVVLQ